MAESVSFSDKVRSEIMGFDNLLFAMSKTTLRRVISYVLYIILFIVVVASFMWNTITEYREKQNDFHARESLIRDRNLMEYAIEVVSLCNKSLNDNDRLKDFNCDEAVKAYSMVSKNWPKEGTDEFVTRRAFSAMELEIKYHVAVNKSSEAAIGAEPIERKHLDLLLSRPVFFLLVIIMVLPPILLVIRFDQYESRNKVGARD